MKPYNSRFHFAKGPDTLKIKYIPLVEDELLRCTCYVLYNVDEAFRYVKQPWQIN